MLRGGSWLNLNHYVFARCAYCLRDQNPNSAVLPNLSRMPPITNLVNALPPFVFIRVHTWFQLLTRGSGDSILDCSIGEESGRVARCRPIRFLKKQAPATTNECHEFRH